MRLLFRRVVGIGLVMILLGTAATVAIASVGLTEFDAVPGPDTAEITVFWETETESDTVAFQVVRSTEPLVQTAIVVTTLPSAGSGTSGARYDFVDSDLVQGQRYYYWLYVISSSGDFYLLTQAVSAVAPAQPVLSRRTFFPLAFRSN